MRSKEKHLARSVWSAIALHGLTLLTLACGGDATGPGTDPAPRPPRVAAVEVSPPADTLRALGDTVRLTAVARDESGAELSGRTITWSSSDPAVLRVDETGAAVALANGTAEIRATIDGVSGAAELAVLQAVAEVALEPAAAQLSTVGAVQQFSATVSDANGNVVEGVRIVWQSSDPAVAVVDTAGRALARGEGEATIAAVAAGVPGYAALRVTQEAAALAFRTQPASAVAGEPLSPAVQVEIRDAAGNVVETATDAITLSLGSNPGAGRLGGTVTVNAVNGVATFSGLWVDRAASGYTLAASAGGLGQASSAAFDIAPAAAARLAFVAGPTGTLVAGDAFAVKVAVQDAYGNTVPDAAARVRLAVADGPASAALAGVLEADAFDGVAAFPDLVATAAGEYTLRASAAPFDGAVGAAFTLVAGAPARLGFVQTPARAEGREPFSVRVAIQDAYGNPIADAADSVSLELSGDTTGAVLGGTVGAAATGGVAAFDGLTIDLPGSYTLRATAAGLTEAFSDPVPVGLTVASVHAGTQHTCGLTTSGWAYCWGWNQTGQLGNPATSGFQLLPIPVAGSDRYRTLTAGGDHTCGLTADGAAYCWGSNSWGQLGRTGGAAGSPTAVSGGYTFDSLVAGISHTCGLTAAGAAYCWGLNLSGQLGDSTTTSSDTPRAVATVLTFSSIEPGGSFTCALATDGMAYCWGSNQRSQLGDGSGTDQPAPVPVSGVNVFAQIATGSYHACGLRSNGTVYCWGGNDRGQLGIGSNTDQAFPREVLGGLRFTAIAAGYTHTCGITTDGATYCWGSNDYGELGDGGGASSRNVPTLVSGGHTFTRLTAAYQHTCGVTAAGETYCWGGGTAGQLGSGSQSGSFVPVRVRH